MEDLYYILSKIAYRFFIGVYPILVKVAGWFSPKANKWVAGRKHWKQSLRIAALNQPVWMHCASLGEFEQGKPVLAAIRQMDPDVDILVTFFSPSGYEYCKDTDWIDLVSYLPMDSPATARKFLELVVPKMALFVKYEFWYYYLQETSKQGIPLFLLSAVFDPDHVFFRPYGALHRRMLTFFDTIFVQDERSAALLQSVYSGEVLVSGDTRIDRVASMAKSAATFPLIESFIGFSPVMIWGSTHDRDDSLLHAVLASESSAGWKMIVAPHEIHETRLRHIQQQLPESSIKYSQLPVESASRILILDTIGMLSRLYQYADLAYIGGGFGTGIHNTLEPMAFGVPVLMGPRHQKFSEAIEAKQNGAARVVNHAADMVEAFETWQTIDIRNRAAQAAAMLIQRKRGATERVMAVIAPNL